jgi:hypothetical protein
MQLPLELSKAVVADFDGGDLTSDGGVVLLAQADRKIGLSAALATALRDTRQQSKVAHTQVEMVRSRLFAIACGYADANDLDSLRHDPAFKVVSGQCPLSGAALASQPTLSRFENRVGKCELLRLGQVLAQRVVAQLPAQTRRVIIDIDASDDPCHGQQQLEGFNGYYGEHCYLPLFVHLTDERGVQWPLAALLRPGRVTPTLGVRALLERTVQFLRERFSEMGIEVEILVRADSGFGCDEVLRTCERLQVRYLIGLPSNRRLQVLGQATQAKCEAAYQAQVEFAQHAPGGAASGGLSCPAAEVTCSDGCREFGEFEYKAGSWAHQRRTIIKVEMTQGKLNPRYVVTDLREWGGQVLDAEAIYELYCGRGEQENRIKEMKLDLDSGRTSCHRFLANQARLLLHLAAHLLWTVVRVAAAGTRWAKAQVATLQLQVQKVAARVRETTRRVWLHLCTGYPYQRDWRLLQERLSST